MPSRSRAVDAPRAIRCAAALAWAAASCAAPRVPEPAARAAPGNDPLAPPAASRPAPTHPDAATAGATPRPGPPPFDPALLARIGAPPSAAADWVAALGATRWLARDGACAEVGFHPPPCRPGEQHVAVARAAPAPARCGNVALLPGRGSAGAAPLCANALPADLLPAVAQWSDEAVALQDAACRHTADLATRRAECERRAAAQRDAAAGSETLRTAPRAAPGLRSASGARRAAEPVLQGVEARPQGLGVHHGKDP